MKSRPKIKLHASLEHRLTMYTLAASATSAGLLSCSQTASAKVVYTKAHEQVLSNSPLALDLNHDGVTDFSFSFLLAGYGSIYALIVAPQPFNQVAGYCGVVSGECWASALQTGIRVGQNQRFGPNQFMAEPGGCSTTSSSSKSYCRSFGPWGNVRGRYLGLQFILKGKPHYGWARFNVDLNLGKAILTGYAYETIARKSLITGKTKEPDVITLEPGSLGHLARGTSGIRRLSQ